MEVFDEDLWVLILSTIRYSLGRSTYMTSYSLDLLFKYSKALSKSQLIQVEKEIIKEILRFRRTKRKISDHKIWLNGALKIGRIRRGFYSNVNS